MKAAFVTLDNSIGKTIKASFFPDDSILVIKFTDSTFTVLESGVLYEDGSEIQCLDGCPSITEMHDRRFVEHGITEAGEYESAMDLHRKSAAENEVARKRKQYEELKSLFEERG